MPPKLPPTKDDLKLKVRTEGRVGKLRVSDSLFDTYGRDTMLDVFDRIKLQVFKGYHFDEPNNNGYTLYYGYCELFEPIPGVEKIPTYDLQLDLEHGGTTVELFKLSE